MRAIRNQGRRQKIISQLYSNNEFSNRYFETARGWQNRSILFVCEDFDTKADAKRSLLKHY